MKSIGSVDIPQKAFMSVLKLGSDWRRGKLKGSQGWRHGRN